MREQPSALPLRIAFWVMWAFTKAVWTIILWPLAQIAKFFDAYVRWVSNTGRDYWLHEIGRKK